jgi:hypothetical protein
MTRSVCAAGTADKLQSPAPTQRPARLPARAGPTCLGREDLTSPMSVREPEGQRTRMSVVSRRRAQHSALSTQRAVWIPSCVPDWGLAGVPPLRHILGGVPHPFTVEVGHRGSSAELTYDDGQPSQLSSDPPWRPARAASELRPHTARRRSGAGDGSWVFRGVKTHQVFAFSPYLGLLSGLFPRRYLCP